MLFTRIIPLLRWVRWGVAVACGVVLVALWIGPSLPATPRQDRPASHIALDIMPVRPGGPPQGYAAYLPSTALRVPTHSTISVTVRNFDLDSTTVPADSPYANVEGTVGGVAYADGQAYRSLDRTAIAHTFTVPQLGLNVPIPGRAPGGQHVVIVTFSFRTAGPGTYAWQCFDPCGNGPDGLGGPMAALDYMRGSLSVEG